MGLRFGHRIGLRWWRVFGRRGLHNFGRQHRAQPFGQLFGAVEIHILDDQVATDGADLRHGLHERGQLLHRFGAAGRVVRAEHDADRLEFHSSHIVMLELDIAHLEQGLVDLDGFFGVVIAHEAQHAIGVVDLRHHIEHHPAGVL